MKKLVIAMMVGLIGFTSAVLPSYATEEADATSGATTEEAQQSSSEETQQSSSVKESGKGKHVAKEEVAEPENAIGKDAAKEKALTDAGLTSNQTGKVRSRVSTLEDGTVIYKVKFTYDSQKYSYKINALSGEVLDKSTEAVTESDATTKGKSKGSLRGKHGSKTEVAEPENAIGKDAAKEKALTDAGLTSDQTGKVRSRVSTLEDGTVIYKVKFTSGNQKYTYQINALTGAVVEKTVE